MRTRRMRNAVIRFTVVAGFLIIGSPLGAWAEEPTAPTAPKDQGVQERAVPPGASCTIVTYYSDAAKTKQVGTFSNCPGPKRGLTGRKTKFFESEKIPLGGPRPQGSPAGPGSLPCEFLKEGCGNLPTPR